MLAEEKKARVPSPQRDLFPLFRPFKQVKEVLGS